MSKGLITLIASLAAVVAFLAINIVSTKTLPSARLDLTEGRLYTLSAGAKSIASKLDEPIHLTFYFSEKAANDYPEIQSYGHRVRETLDELARSSGGKISIEQIDPLPYSQQQDDADQAGVFGAPTSRGNDRLYFGIVGRNSTDQRQIIPMLNPRSEEFLEYDLTRIIYLLSNPKKAVVGLMTSLPMEGTQPNPMVRRGQQSWQIVTQMKEMFDVRTIPLDVAAIPSDVSVLFVAHPKQISDRALYAIDQFVMRGGRLVACVDPWCESDVPAGMDMMQAMQIPKGSDMNKLFSAWGFEVPTDQVVADRTNALRVTIGSQARPETVSFVAWLGITQKGLNRTDAISGTLQNIALASVGSIRKKDGATIGIEPLIESSEDSMLIDVKQVEMLPDPKKLLASFVSGGEKRTIAARISGKVKSAFPGGDPSKPAPAPGETPAPTLTESKEPIQAVVIADCDMLADRFWVQEDRLGGVVLGMRKAADNADFIVQSIDNLGGSSDLISVRARSRSARPFELVQKLQRDAEQKFRAKEQELEERVQATEAKMAELRKQKPETGGALLTPEQKEELTKLQAVYLDTRKELRDVQFNLRRDVDRLGTKIKAINIAVMPVLVALAAVGLALWRVNRRRSWKHQSSDRS
jgi:ABC-type uncharacterized transport system involved in gliding motility auxiliary subunit